MCRKRCGATPPPPLGAGIKSAGISDLYFSYPNLDRQYRLAAERGGKIRVGRRVRCVESKHGDGDAGCKGR